MSEKWHYNRSGRQYGPVSGTELRRLASAGELSANDLIWKEGMADWVPAARLKGLIPSGRPDLSSHDEPDEFDEAPPRIGISFSRFLSVRPFLRRLDSGEIVASSVGIAWQVAVGLLAIIALAGWAYLWRDIAEMKFFLGVSFGIFQVFSIVAMFFAFQVLFLRGRDVASCREGRFIAVPIVARFFSALAEAAAIYLVIMGIPAMLLIWFGGAHIVPYLPAAKLGDSIIVTIFTGVTVLVSFWLTAVLVYFGSRVLCEMMLALFSIANGVERLVGIAEARGPEMKAHD